VTSEFSTMLQCNNKHTALRHIEKSGSFKVRSHARLDLCDYIVGAILVLFLILQF